MKKISLIMLVQFFAFASKCPLNCYVIKSESKEDKIVLSPENFKLNVQNEYGSRSVCMAKKESFGSVLFIEVSDILATDTIISIRNGQKLLASSSFSGEQGSLSLYAEGLRITCSR